MFIRNTTRIELWKMLNLFWSNDFGRVCVSGKGIELSLWEMVSRVTCIVSRRALHGIVVSCRELLLGSLGNWIPMREQPESGARLSENKETERRLWGIFLTFPRILDSYTKCRNYNIHEGFQLDQYIIRVGYMCTRKCLILSGEMWNCDGVLF